MSREQKSFNYQEKAEQKILSLLREGISYFSERFFSLPPAEQRKCEPANEIYQGIKAYEASNDISCLKGPLDILLANVENKKRMLEKILGGEEKIKQYYNQEAAEKRIAVELNTLDQEIADDIRKALAKGRERMGGKFRGQESALQDWQRCCQRLEEIKEFLAEMGRTEQQN